jgi:hypothetical protein
MSENDFECLARTGVNTPEAMLPKLEMQFDTDLKEPGSFVTTIREVSPKGVFSGASRNSWSRKVQL